MSEPFAHEANPIDSTTERDSSGEICCFHCAKSGAMACLNMSGHACHFMEARHLPECEGSG